MRRNRKTLTSYLSLRHLYQQMSKKTLYILQVMWPDMISQLLKILIIVLWKVWRLYSQCEPWWTETSRRCSVPVCNSFLYYVQYHLSENMQKVTDEHFSEHSWSSDHHIYGYSNWEDQSRTLANILINNYYCSASTPRLGKESKQKIIKLL